MADQFLPAPGEIIWEPRGGHLGKTICANAHVFTALDETGEPVTIIRDVGLGQRPGGGGGLEVPDLRDVLIGPDGKTAGGRPPAKAIVISHGHDDHYGGLLHYAKAGYTLPPIHASGPTRRAIIDQFAAEGLRPPPIQMIGEGTTVGSAPLDATPFSMPHSIPGAFGFAYGGGRVIDTSDFTMDETKLLGRFTDPTRMPRRPARGVDLAIVDGCGILKSGMATEELDVREAVWSAMRQHPGQRVVNAVPSHFHERIASLAMVARESGRAMVVDSAIAKQIELMREGDKANDIKGMFPELRLVEAGSAEHRALAPEDQLVVIGGARGEKSGSLYAAARGKHPEVNIDPGDVVLIAASRKGWGGGEVAEAVKPLERRGQRVITTDEERELDSGGHGNEGDIALLCRKVGARTVVCTHVTDRMEKEFWAMCDRRGFNTIKEPIRNGNVIRLAADGTTARVSDRQMPLVPVGDLADRPQAATKGVGVLRHADLLASQQRRAAV